jgi:penicillin-binding protein 1A
VHTTIDLELEEAARSALRSHLEALDERHRYRGPLEPPRRRRNRRPPPSVNELVVGRSYQAVVTGADDENGEVLLDVGGRPARASIPPRYNPEGLAPSAFALEGARVHVSLVAPADEDGGEDADKTASAEVALELGPEGAVVVIDPRSRDVLALVGGYGAVAGFDRATRALRQPGSTFKPIVYALGIRSRRYTPASIVIDAPAVYDEWRPENFEEWNYAGQIRLRDAVAKSVNVVAVRVIEDVSPAEVVGFARQLGIRSELEPTLGLALGSSAVLPIELVNAYATFAAFGRYEEPRLVTRIEGPNGRDVPLPAREPPRDVLTPAEAYLVTSLLTSVVTDGTARAALALERPAAGKTGTSNEARDAWFVGYTPSTVAGVWVGFDDNRSLGRRESGGRAALPVWMDVIRTAERGRPPVDFPVPSGVVTVAIDPESGLLPWEGMESPLSEVFLEGTEPTETARPPDVADSSTFLMEQMGGPEPSEPSTGETSPGVPPPAPPPPATP